MAITSRPSCSTAREPPRSLSPSSRWASTRSSPSSGGLMASTPGATPRSCRCSLKHRMAGACRMPGPLIRAPSIQAPSMRDRTAGLLQQTLARTTMRVRRLPWMLARTTTEAPRRLPTRAMAVERLPSPTRAMAVEQLPSPTRAMAVERLPSPTRAMAVERLPSPTRAMAVERLPSRTRAMAVERLPSPTRAMAVERLPSPTRAMAVERLPSPTRARMVE
ncbi:hypothetical protein HUA75_33090 [Myxococcus sp. CA040A]|nr:hypothetical protein [Myxococcus sp. CA040A]